jgi:CRP-like cAMP-binding protein
MIVPAAGSRLIQDEQGAILVGQPPDVLKGLLRQQVKSFDTIILTDVREKDGALLNHLEFPVYFFLFFAAGLAEGKKIKLLGSRLHISHALRLIRMTLTGPTATEFEQWHTTAGLRQEWLDVSNALALRDATGNVIDVETFFEPMPLDDGPVQAGSMLVEHTGIDQYRITNTDGAINVDLNEDQVIEPSYKVQSDYIPGGLVKMGLEILGGASGFTLDEPCTGLALCYNGDYLLIDSVPFLDEHLLARGISKNQVSAVFLTHLHDDHCAMFPLMMMPHRVEIITTREIFAMAMEKLACGLGWSIASVSEHFSLIEITPFVAINYFGLTILPHITVHSIPTIGATFSTSHGGLQKQLCIVGDNHDMGTIRQLHGTGVVSDRTMHNLERLYQEKFSLLIADGGAGAIHGNPEDALQSQAERVVFVHVDDLPSEFNNTFSLASAGKRYTLLDGDASIYTSQVGHYLTQWLGKALPSRWMRSLLAEQEIRRYNTDDVVIVQDADTRGLVYLILTGYCTVIRHDGSQFHKIADLQAGDVIGEMAIITGHGTRNASIVARTPVTVCIFAEETFAAFIETQGFKDELLRRWALRPVVRNLPQFIGMNSTTLENIGRLAHFAHWEAGQQVTFDSNAWYLLADGTVNDDGVELEAGAEYGFIPLRAPRMGPVDCQTDAIFIRFDRQAVEQARLAVPQLNYLLRKFRLAEGASNVDWLLAEVAVR